MFSFFKGKTVKKEELTFKKRVQFFWEWYTSVAPRFFETIETGKCPALATEVSTQVDKFFPGMAWVFGPGEGGVGHSFTLSGEGVLHKQLLTQFWHNQAPRLNGWTFYPARQPGSVQNILLKIDGRDFKPAEFWLTPTVNPEQKKVDVIAWHPLFGILEKKQCMSALFLFLDETLGEYGTEQWIGEIKLNDQRLADAIPLGELLAYTKNLQKEKCWEKLPPGQAAFAYRFKEPHERFLRGDIIAGTTMNSKLVGEYISVDGALVDPLAGMGADYVFITIDAAEFPKGRQVEVRAAMEDAIDKKLRANASGRLIGGAFGTRYAYIDLLLFDAAESLKSIQNIWQEQNLPKSGSLNYFAKEKRGHRLVLS